MLNQPSLSEKVIVFLSAVGDSLDYPKSINQLISWERHKYFKGKVRLKDQEIRQRKRLRRAFKNLESAELLSFNKKSNKISLTPAGWTRYLYYVSKQKTNQQQKTERNKYIIIFDIPEEFRRFRDLFRQCLINKSCSLMQKSVFVAPNKDVFSWAQKVVANCHLDGYVKFIEASKVY